MSRAAVVLFDLDGTLLDHDRAEQEAILDWVAAEGWPSRVNGIAVVSVWHQIAEEEFVEYRSGKLTFQGQRRARVRRLLSEVGDDRSSLDDEAIDRMFAAYHARYRASWIAFPDVLPCVEAVSATYRVAVPSNGDLSEKVAKVQAIGLEPYVEITMASSDLGFAKPDPRAFHRSLTRLGSLGHEVVHVGDQLGRPRSERCWPVRSLAGSQRPRSADPGVHTIRSLAELPSWLAEPYRARR